jgi:ATP-binding cassette, subfamily B, bacterial
MKILPVSNLSFAWQYLKTEKKAFILAIIFVIINALLQTLTPVSIEYLINNAIKTPNYELLWKVISGMCLLFLLEAGLFRTQVKTVGYAAQRIMVKIRTKLFGHLQNLPTSYFGQNQSGDLISRINSDTTLLDNFLGQYIFSFTSSFFVFIAFGIYLLILNPVLALVAYFGVFITFLISYASSSIGKRINKKALSNNGILKSYLSDNLNNYQVIQAYNIHASLSSNFQAINAENQKVNFAGRIFTNIFNPIYNFTSYLAVLLILIAIFYFKLGANQLYIGTLVAFLFATIKFFTPLRDLGSVFGSLAEVQAALGRIREILDEPVSDVFKLNKDMVQDSPLEGWQAKPDGVDTMAKKTNLDLVKQPNDNGEAEATSTTESEDSRGLKFSSTAANSTAIQFNNVSFQYTNTDNQVFDSISFSVPTNSKFAIIGPTGEGKSTIAKLMSGLLSPNSGTVKVFDRELKEWTQSDFYNTIGFILQDPFLFTGTVASNIAYGNPRYEQFNMEIIEEKAKGVEIPLLRGGSEADGVDSVTEKTDLDSKNQGTYNGDTEAASTTENRLDNPGELKFSSTDRLIQALIADIQEHNLGSIIPTLPEFLATEVNNNSQNISQGQRQIVNFIRVLLREPQILILDEATANLDTITETYLQTALDKLTNKVTQIIIAHRQNTIKDADQIMLVGGGKVELTKNK